VLLASASDAIIIGFNVRPTGNARQIADKENKHSAFGFRFQYGPALAVN
jgi:hypothetical protein